MALIDSGSKVNEILLTFIAKLGFTSSPTNVGTQKINGLLLETYAIILASFLLQKTLEKVQFFEGTFLRTDTSMKMIVKMLFLKLSNMDIKFQAGKFTEKTYTITKALPRAERVELIDKHKFAKASFDDTFETFVI